jgi:hypothetical protein
MLELAPGDFVQILFSISDLSDDEVVTYLDLSNQMLATVRILTPPAKP